MMVLQNYILFQIGWFACVLSAAANQPLIGAILACIIIAVHISLSKDRLNEIALILFAMFIGMVWDGFLVWREWIVYPSGMLVPNAAPYWIIIMWGLFATTVNVSMAWLKNKILLATVFGAIAGPLAYYAASKMNALQFNDPSMAWIALSIGWAVLTPLLFRFAVYLEDQRMKKTGEVL